MEENIENWRKKINNIDTKILHLLENRMKFVEKIGKEKIKKNINIYNPQREKEILQNLHKVPKNFLTNQAIDIIFQEIFAISRNLEAPEKIVFLGSIGDHTHQIARKKFGAISEYIATNNPSTLTSLLKNKQAKYAIFPLKHTSSGIQKEILSLLLKEEIKIIATLSLSPSFVFASKNPAIQIKKIYIKNSDLIHCQTFLESKKIKNFTLSILDSYTDFIEYQEEKDAGIFCSEFFATLYHLPILFKNIGHTNTMHFFMIGDYITSPSKKDKTSACLIPKTHNKIKDLVDLLQDLENQNKNLLKIDSCFVDTDDLCGFYLEFEGHRDEENLQKLFKKKGEILKWLGSYPYN
ncbi:bifunctional chorismate mutase/prephenate dehydratase [Helicobacter anatolicus]|uniref:bifunctional chorismate mutase/prephenate dehydratase n=1 Tax=Helicobacter anatolicus TaxID=2905874 RepID=UPI001E650119|nr:bifunctional chorismate mutase/prephenate dehydratase [Helicobacter anatolicus]MCE3038550.1 chorismate mutase [Helicobacter anatolicus]